MVGVMVASAAKPILKDVDHAHNDEKPRSLRISKRPQPKKCVSCFPWRMYLENDEFTKSFNKRIKFSRRAAFGTSGHWRLAAAVVTNGDI
eukprot:5707452-Pyramimonas_sp.AAC.1